MARISLNPPRTPLFRVVDWYCRRRYGDMVDPGKALGHNPRVLYAELRFEQAVAFVELTVMVGIENLRSRVNSALGLRSQGFADRCEVPQVPSQL
jgi:hypothetical protein